MNVDASFALSRHQMIHEQLRRRGIHDRRVLAAMEAVPRERFVDAPLAELAYADRALSIACGQTISQPYMVALMSEALGLSGRERVLEIGTGSGYQTAVLAELAAEIITIERHAVLLERARATLDDLGYRNIQYIQADGTLGWQAAAPYQGILVAAAAAECPPALLEQLADPGTLVLPLGSETGQMLERFAKRGGHVIRETLVSCRFVPLVPSLPVESSH